MKKFVRLLLMPVAVLSLTTASYAQDFRMGDETKGMKVKISDNTDISFRVRMQPRLDMGDLVKNEAETSYESEIDNYLRRTRLEIGGNMVKELKYSLVFEADKNGKFASSSGSPANEVKIQTANIDYKFNDLIGVRFGKAKLPYSRVSLTSSSKQLIVERPVSTEAAKKLFDDYYQSHLMFSGKASEGLFAYNFAIADGWEPNSTITGTTVVHKSSPLYIARFEVSPPGWTESSQSDAHLGKGKHLAIGANYATQKGIEYKASTDEEDRTLTGVDVSGHWEGFTGQLEYNAWKVESTVAANSKEPKGWYLQAGYLIPDINVEPVARYEVYDQDSNSDNKQEKTSTIGVNWYLKGHSMKIGLNRVSTKYDNSATGWLANADTKDTYQLQAQLYF
jgi:phosphate-selective porin OprO/OprP